MSRASAIVFNSIGDDQDELTDRHLAQLIGTFLSNRQSANALQTLTYAYSARSYVRHVGDEMWLAADMNGDITTENEAHIKTAVGPAVVTALRDCGAGVMKLVITGVKTPNDQGTTGIVTMVMTVKMARMPNTEFRIRFLSNSLIFH